MAFVSRCWTWAFNVLALGMVALVALVSWSVVARIADLDDAYWVEDMSRLILLWVGLLFVPSIQFEDRHIASDFVQPRSQRLRRAREALKHIVFFAIGAVWLWYGGVMVQRELGMLGAGGMELPLFYFNSVIPVAGFLMAFIAIMRLVSLFVGPAPQS